MGGSPNNFVESYLPMITMYAIVGHEVFRYPASKPRLRLSIFYTIFTLITCIVILYLTVRHAFMFTYDTIEEKLFLFICGLNVVIVLSTGILSWYHYDRRKRVMERIMAVDETLTELGADCQHEKTYRFTITFLVIHLIVVMILNSVDAMWVIGKYSVLEMIWLVVVMHHPYHVSTYVLMTWSMIMRVLSIRFKLLNKILKDIVKESGRLQPAIISRRFTQRMEPIQVTSRDDNHKHTVQIIKQVHLELCTISEDLCTSYGVQIVMKLGAYFAFLTVLGYDLYVIYVNPTFMSRTRRICALSFWFMVYFMKIMAVNHMSASVTYEAYKTREIIQELNMMSNDPDFKDEVRQFCLQMIENTLSFAPMGFVTLGYGLVASVLGTVATYLVILIQTNIIPEFMLVNNK